jgi:hypothetical protein
MLKKNINIKEDRVLKLYNTIKKSGAENLVNGSMLRFLINLVDDGINVASELINKLVEYYKFLQKKKSKIKNKSKKGFKSDNIKEEIFSKMDKEFLDGFVKEIDSLFSNGEKRGSFYFILPFLTGEENFYSEIKFFYEKNDLGEKDYGVAANLHFATGEVKLRATCIKRYIYIKLYFENEIFLNLCKGSFDLKDKHEFIESVSFLKLEDIEYDSEVLFSDLYFKDEEIEF